MAVISPKFINRLLTNLEPEPLWFKDWIPDEYNKYGEYYHDYLSVKEPFYLMLNRTEKFNLLLFIKLYKKIYDLMWKNITNMRKLYDKQFFCDLFNIGYGNYKENYKAVIMARFSEIINFEEYPDLFEDFTEKDAQIIRDWHPNSNNLIHYKNIQSLINRTYL